MSAATDYIAAMIAGRTNECASIEQDNGLYGYPPELVSVGLAAVAEGRDPQFAIEDYIAGGAE